MPELESGMTVASAERLQKERQDKRLEMLRERASQHESQAASRRQQTAENRERWSRRIDRLKMRQQRGEVWDSEMAQHQTELVPLQRPPEEDLEDRWQALKKRI